jgi:AcrR family transcriptional regulator
MSSTREALVAAATDLVDAGGDQAVTLREVGKRAGVSHNAPYKHFRDKCLILTRVKSTRVSRRIHMHSPMIDREEAVAHFRALIDPVNPLCVLRLLGEA